MFKKNTTSTETTTETSTETTTETTTMFFLTFKADGTFVFLILCYLRMKGLTIIFVSKNPQGYYCIQGIGKLPTSWLCISSDYVIYEEHSNEVPGAIPIFIQRGLDNSLQRKRLFPNITAVMRGQMSCHVDFLHWSSVVSGIPLDEWRNLFSLYGMWINTMRISGQEISFEVSGAIANEHWALVFVQGTISLKKLNECDPIHLKIILHVEEFQK